MTTCSIDGCAKPADAGRGWCMAHYTKWRRYGDPLAGRTALPRTMTLAERFWTYVERGADDECWLWTGFLIANGYGRLSRDGRREYAHRISYELATGRRVPSVLDVHHRCETRACVNPAHLAAIPRSDHRHEHGHPAACPKGHDYTPANTYVNPKGVKICRTCQRLSNRASARRAAQKDKTGMLLSSTPNTAEFNVNGVRCDSFPKCNVT